MGGRGVFCIGYGFGWFGWLYLAVLFITWEFFFSFFLFLYDSSPEREGFEYRADVFFRDRAEVGVFIFQAVINYWAYIHQQKLFPKPAVSS